VVAPLLYLLRPGVAENLARFVEHGGVLLTTFFSGIVDQYDRVPGGGYPGALRKLLGIHVEEFDPLLPEMSNAVVIEEGPLAGTYPCDLWGELIRLEGARAIGSFARDYYARQPALTVHTYGQGQAWYLATRGNDDLVDKLTSQLRQQAGVAPLLTVPAGVEVTSRRRFDGRQIFFVLNSTPEAVRIPLPTGTFRSLLDDREVAGEGEVAAGDILVLLESAH
jgi:beta-galactosidase